MNNISITILARIFHFLPLKILAPAFLIRELECVKEKLEEVGA